MAGIDWVVLGLVVLFLVVLVFGAIGIWAIISLWEDEVEE